MISAHPFRNLPEIIGRLSHWVAERPWLLTSDFRSQNEKDELLAAIDRSMSDMTALTRSEPGTSVLLSYRIGSAGLDLSSIQSEQAGLYREFVRECGDCTQWRRCARDLAHPAPTGAADYCANAAAIDALAHGTRL